MPLDYETPPNLKPEAPKVKIDPPKSWVYLAAIAVFMGLFYLVWLFIRSRH